jgi:hypothetical protein
MKNFGIFLVVILISFIVISSASPTPTTKQEHKKKLLDKLRAALNSNDTEQSPLATIPTVDEVIEDKVVLEEGEDEGGKEGTSVSLVQDEIGGGEADASFDGNTNPTTTDLMSNTYMGKYTCT